MTRRTPAFLFLMVTVCLTGLWASVSGIRLEPARTRVGMASVYLRVSDLTVSGADLTGTYAIHVPLAPWQDDQGAIRLTFGEPADVVAAAGGHATGTALSDFNGKTHAVDCRIEPNGDVRIVVVTDKRTLSFDTRYEGLVSSASARDAALPTAR